MIERLKNRVFLAPMAGVADRAYREIAAEFGAGLVFTEMVSAKGLYYNDKKTEALLTAGDCSCPVSAQIFGHEPEIIAKVISRVKNYGATFADINAGCPTPKIVSNGDGAALMKNPELFGEIVKSAVKNAGCEVSVKIRKGWNDESVNAVEIAKIAEKNGAAMITVHGRTVAQQYSGKADWDIIKKVVEGVNIPVVGNGDIFCADDAVRMIEKTGCAAVMLGRGTLGNPWLIRDTVCALGGEKIPPPASFDEKISLALRHIGLIIKYKGEYVGVREARKHAMWYVKGVRGSSAVKNLLSKAQSFDEMKNILTSL
ncbi:MAG: tRNA-dihydrouridine synthase C [Firmicutes bacterium ADurb.Bin193]|nr:MAG: tRNA-dihydrouridine synthase C [Firmicutes bacterium ADurb.Bin193]